MYDLARKIPQISRKAVVVVALFINCTYTPCAFFYFYYVRLLYIKRFVTLFVFL